jgi:hypothetical protein
MLPPYGGRVGCTAQKGEAGEVAPPGEEEGAAWLKGESLRVVDEASVMRLCDEQSDEVACSDHVGVTRCDDANFRLPPLWFKL